MAEVQWYYARNDQQFGPVSASELKQLADAGRLSPDDLLWREGMESWATAVNLRGLFSPEATAPAGSATQATQTALANKPAESSTPARPQPAPAGLRGPALRGVMRTTQIIMWTMCVLVVLTGVVLFTRAFLVAESATEEAAAAAVFATFFIAAYVLARSGEKLSDLLTARRRRR